ncbi:uncharacterized protein LOC100903004 [Galendromus occidentalis]|uniref:Uncharacterized protein LOC100903004 n=1 Tax=Galendromus occidentalis TaxID=34638 RepID=A0AAJ6QY76_9ACAR|nr:uncharacterized protein LOC100903004 [Galendromus occidentalis]
MQLKHGTKLRRYIFMQQGLIGIAQGISTLFLLEKRSNPSDAWIAGITGGMNFVLSLVIVGHFGVDLYPENVDEGVRVSNTANDCCSCPEESETNPSLFSSVKQDKAVLMIAAAVLGNLMALGLILNRNRGPELSRMLTFQEEGISLQAFAVFFHLTVYVTVLLVISLVTYCLIYLMTGDATADPEKAKEKNKNKKERANHRNPPEVLVDEPVNEANGMRKEAYFVAPRSDEDRNRVCSNDRGAHGPRHFNRKPSSLCSRVVPVRRNSSRSERPHQAASSDDDFAIPHRNPTHRRRDSIYPVAPPPPPHPRRQHSGLLSGHGKLIR